MVLDASTLFNMGPGQAEGGFLLIPEFGEHFMRRVTLVWRNDMAVVSDLESVGDGPRIHLVQQERLRSWRRCKNGGYGAVATWDIGSKYESTVCMKVV